MPDDPPGDAQEEAARFPAELNSQFADVLLRVGEGDSQLDVPASRFLLANHSVSRESYPRALPRVAASCGALTLPPTQLQPFLRTLFEDEKQMKKKTGGSRFIETHQC